MINEKTKTIVPTIRPRRMRLSKSIRRMVRETSITLDDFIYPLFVRYGKDQKKPIASMPGQFQITVDKIAAEAKEVYAMGIPAVLMFGIPEHKDWCGTDNFSQDGVVPQAIRAIKDAVPELLVISDMCFCEYTDHGHCGVVNLPDNQHYDPKLPEGYLLNDPTLELLEKASIVHAESGADIIAPSGMIDGMVGGIRSALDHTGYDHVAVMSYAAKYSSSFYGPFRDAAEGSPSFGDRSTSQMDPGNRREAIKEIALDVEEGADMLMVKPAMPYLDIISDLRQHFDLPTAAYQVSGEFSMIHAAAMHGWLDLESAAMESLMSIKRAGADMIITYFAKDAVKWLEKS